MATVMMRSPQSPRRPSGALTGASLAGILLPLLLLAAPALEAQTALSRVEVSAGTHSRIYEDASETVSAIGSDRDLFVWDTSGPDLTVSTFLSGPENNGVDLTGYHRNQNLFVIDTARNIDGTLVRASDVYTTTPGSPPIRFDGRANALPAGVNLDAVTIDPASGDLVFSFDRSVGASPLFRRADLVRWNGSVYSHFFQGTMLPPAADINGAHILDSGNILMTFESGITVPGSGGSFYVRDDQVVEFDTGTGLFAMTAVDLQNHPSWQRAGMDALWAVEGGDVDVIFADRFED